MPRLKIVLWAVIAGLVGIVTWLALDPNAPFGRNAVSAVSRTFAPIVQPIANQFPFLQFGTLSRPTTILFMGTDVVYTDSRRRQADHQATSGNSDTMMLVFLNPEHNTVSVINIPRDTEANVGRYGVRKINSANLLGGPDLARETVSSLLEVPVDHYVVMNIQALVEMVNELGGVTVYVPKKMNYMDWTGKLKIDLEPGYHTLTGNQAMGFVRFRHDSLGDIGRIQRQQLFLQAASKKMLEPASWLHLNKLLEIAQRNIQTDLANVDIFQVLNFAHAVPKDNIKFVMLPGSFADNGDWIANTDSRAIAQRFAYPDNETVRSRRNISVCIVNTTETRSLASDLAKALRKLGYMTCVGKPENEPAGKATRIIAQFGNVAEARMLKQDLGNTGEVINASVGNLQTSITIVLHDDVNLEKVCMSSPDAEYIPSRSRPQPLVSRPIITAKRRKQTELPGEPETLEMSDEMPLESPAQASTIDNTTENSAPGASETGSPQSEFPTTLEKADEHTNGSSNGDDGSARFEPVPQSINKHAGNPAPADKSPSAPVPGSNVEPREDF